MPSTITDRLTGLTTSVAVKAPVRVATTAAIVLTGLQTIDAVALAVGDRVLVKDQADAVENGIYVSNTGAWARAADFNGSFDVVGGTQTFICEGAANRSTYWRTSGTGTLLPGTDDIEFEIIAYYYREPLTANRTYYVRPDGSDSNSGLANTADEAFLTIQHAIDEAYASLDFAGYKITIQVADGAYPESLTIDGVMLGSKSAVLAPLQIVGNTGTPANVVLGKLAGGTVLTVSNNAHAEVAGITFKNAVSGYGWIVRDGAILEHSNCVFDDIFSEMIVTQYGGIVRAIGPLSVTGDAVSFCHAIEQSLIDFSNQTITFNGNTFSQYLWGVNNASINLDSATLTGTKTGQISVHNNGYVNANLASGSWTGGATPEMNGGGLISQTGLMQNLQFYVRTGGSDTNDGLVNTDARAFKTIRGAINRIASFPFEPAMYSDNPITINVAAGTYSETVPLRNLPYVSAAIIGDETTPGNVIVAGLGDAFQAFGLSTVWAIKGVKITAAAGSCIRAAQGGFVTFQKVEFGTATGGYHLQIEDGSYAYATGNYSISGNASAHVLLRMAKANISSVTVTLTGTPAFSTAFAFAESQSALRIAGVTFSGSATGSRYSIATMSLIDTNGAGATYLPGNSGGTGSGTGGALYA